MNEIVNDYQNAISKSIYYARCLRRLKELGAPLSGWRCVGVTDVCDGDLDASLFTCELCDCDKVRYVHTMQHKDYPGDICVGCICAGVMENDIPAAQERERVLRNRAKRKSAFLKRKWKQCGDGEWSIQYRGQQLRIEDRKGWFCVFVGKRSTAVYHRRAIRDLSIAYRAVFDMADPPPEVL